MTTISVVICTWNRADLLDQTLRRMTALEIPSDCRWDLVVVNNASPDHTDAVLAGHRGSLPLTVLHEERPGVVHARNAGAAAASGELVIWTDDDVLVDADWLAAYVRAAAAWPQAAYFAGRVDPLYGHAPPRWIERNIDLLRSAYAMTPQDDSIRPLDDAERPVGANMAFRREVFDRFQFDPRLGRVGPSNVRGEECDLFARLRQAGLSGLWVGPARVEHYIPPERLTLDYLRDYYYGYGRTEERRYGPRGGRDFRGAPLWAVRQYWQHRLAAAATGRFRGRTWLSHYIRMQISRGIVDEARARRNAAGEPPGCGSCRPVAEKETVSAC